MTDDWRVLAAVEAVERLESLIKRELLGKADTDRLRRLEKLFTDTDRVSLASAHAALFPEATEDVAVAFRAFKKRFNDQLNEANLLIRLESDTKKGNPSKRRAWLEGTPAISEEKAEALVSPTRAYDPSTYVPPKAASFTAVTFAGDVERTLSQAAPKEWTALASPQRDFLCSLISRLQPFVQIVPATGSPHVVGFEALGTTLQGDAFPQIVAAAKASGIPRDLVHLALLRVALKTANTLRELAEQEGEVGARHLRATVNVDSETLRSPSFDRFLDLSSPLLFEGLAFEVHEESDAADVTLFLRARAADGVRLVLDDVNAMSQETRGRLAPHADLAKVDVREFRRLVKNAGEDPEGTIAALKQYRLEGKPLLLEGVEEHWEYRFLQERWPEGLGALLGQGFLFKPSDPWSRWLDLLPEGAARGYVLARVPAAPRLTRRPARLEESSGFEQFVEDDGYAQQYPPEHYVTAEALTEEGGTEDALSFGLRWLTQEGTPFLVILGDYGAGKTFLCRMLARALFCRRKAGEALPLPVYLDMRHLPSWQDGRVPRLEEMIVSVLQRGQIADVSVEALLKEVEVGRAVLFFDGLDEKTAHLTAAQAAELMANIRSAVPAPVIAAPEQGGPVQPATKAKVIIACRTHYFSEQSAERTELTGGGETGTREGLRATDFRIVYLKAFDLPRIEEYLRKREPERAEGVLELLKGVYNLLDLASRPFLLSLITKHLNDVEAQAREGKIARTGDLYRLIVAEWVKRDVGKHVIKSYDKVTLMEHLAETLWRRGAQQVTFRELRELVARLLPESYWRIQRAEEQERYEIDTRTATFLVRDAAGNYAFAHRSFMEFFLASRVCEGVEGGRPEVLALPALGPEVVEFAIDLLARAGASGARAVEKVLEDDYRAEASENAARIAAAWARRDPEAAPKPAHARLQGARLERSDLSRVHWPNARFAAADLFGANLHGADFEGGGFEGADLRNATARQANFAEASLAGARLDGADFEQARLEGTDLSGAEGPGTSFLDANLTRARLDAASFEAASFVRARLAGVSFAGANLARVVGLGSPRGTPLVVCGPKSGHLSAVRSVCFSPDGKTLASGSSDNTVRVWDAATGKELRTLKGHSSAVRSVCFSPDGKTLASGSSDNTVRVWDAATGKELRTLKGHSSAVRSVCFSPDGKTLASGSYDNTVRVWDAATGKELRTLKGHSSEVLSVCFSPDGKTLASGSYDHTVRVWDAATGKELRTLKGHSSEVWSVCFSPDGKTLASGSSDNTVRVWDAATGKELRTLKGHSSAVWSVCFSPDGKTLASGSYDNTVRVWDAATGKELRTLKGHSSEVLSVCFSPDGKTLASGSYDNTVRVWDAATGKELRTLKGHSSAVRSVCFSPDGKTLASGSYDNTVRVWDAATGKELRTLKGHSSEVLSVCFSPDGKTLASGSYDHTVRVWDAATGKELRTLKGHSSEVLSVCFSPDGKTLASGSYDNTVRVWDAATGKELRTLKGHSSAVRSVCFSPDGKTLASGSYDNTVRVWDAATGKELRTLKGHSSAVRSVCFSPDGKTLASGSYDNTVRVWDAATGKELRTLKGHSSEVLSVCFSPDGKTLASGSYDHTVRVWDAATGKELRTLKGHSSEVRSVCFSPDGKTLASGSSDGSVRLTASRRWSPRFHLGLMRNGWYSAAPGRLPDGDEAGLRTMSYASRDNRVFSGWELRLLAEDGHAFAFRDLDEETFD